MAEGLCRQPQGLPPFPLVHWPVCSFRDLLYVRDSRFKVHPFQCLGGQALLAFSAELASALYHNTSWTTRVSLCSNSLHTNVVFPEQLGPETTIRKGRFSLIGLFLQMIFRSMWALVLLLGMKLEGAGAGGTVLTSSAIGTVMYKDSFQIRDTSGDLEGGKKLRNVQNLWMKVICYLSSPIINEPSKAQYISVDLVSPYSSLTLAKLPSLSSD